jgi:SlyX protein
VQSIENLEIKVAFMDDLIISLNETVYRQQRQIDNLNNRVDQLSKQLKSIKDATGDSGEESPPPHY